MIKIKVFSIFIIALIMFNLNQVSIPVKADWCYSIKMTVDHTKIDADLTDFPVLVYLNSSRVVNWVNIKDDLSDLIFVDSTQKITLDAEIEYYIINDYAIIWVKIPSISSTVDTYFYIHYGNTVTASWSIMGEVWDSSAVLVTHMDNIVGEREVRDYTQFYNDGNKHDFLSPLQVNGLIGLAQSFNGTLDHIIVPTSASIETIDSNKSFSYGLWYKGTGTWLWSHQMVIANEGLRIYISVIGGHVCSSVFVNSTQYVTDTTFNPVIGEWNSVYVTYNGTSIQTYNNGIADATHYDVTGYIGYQGAITIGQWQEIFLFTGDIDEVRLYNVAKSGSWLKADCYSVNDSLLTYSDWDIYNTNISSGVAIFFFLMMMVVMFAITRRR